MRPRWATTGYASEIIYQLAHCPQVFLPQQLQAPCLLPADLIFDDRTKPASSSSLLALQNGLLDLDRFCAGDLQPLMPHTPAFFSMAALPYCYDPAAQAPLFCSYLNDVSGGRFFKRLAILDFLAYVLGGQNRLKAIFALVGPADTGKSVLIRVIQMLLGPKNCSNVQLSNLAEKFEGKPIMGKLVNFAAEVSYVPKKAEAVLKAITGRDESDQPVKGEDAISHKPTAVPVLIGNHELRWHDESDGTYRRLIYLLFDKAVPHDRQLADLDVRLEAELPGILNLVLLHFERQRQRGRLFVSGESQKMVERTRKISQVLRAFVEDVFEVVPPNAATTNTISQTRVCDLYAAQ
jgi:putative DNA primase/helicase